MNEWGCNRPDVFVDVYVDHLRGLALEWAVAARVGYTSSFDYVSWQPKVRVNEVNEPDNIVWWLTIWGKGVQEFAPLTDWLALGKLIDDNDLTVTTTSRDHPDQRFFAFCPHGNGDGGRGYGADKKSALLRSILVAGTTLDPRFCEIEVPYDLAVHSKCIVTERQLANARTCTHDPVVIKPIAQPTPSFEDIAVDNDF